MTNQHCASFLFVSFSFMSAYCNNRLLMFRVFLSRYTRLPQNHPLILSRRLLAMASSPIASEIFVFFPLAKAHCSAGRLTAIPHAFTQFLLLCPQWRITNLFASRKIVIYIDDKPRYFSERPITLPIPTHQAHIQISLIFAALRAGRNS